MHRQKQPLLLVFPGKGVAGLLRQGFNKDKPHAVGVVRAACGICANARAKLGGRIEFLKSRQLVKYGLQQRTAGGVFRFFPHDLANDLFKTQYLPSLMARCRQLMASTWSSCPPVHSRRLNSSRWVICPLPRYSTSGRPGGEAHRG